MKQKCDCCGKERKNHMDMINCLLRNWMQAENVAVKFIKIPNTKNRAKIMSFKWKWGVISLLWESPETASDIHRSVVQPIHSGKIHIRIVQKNIWACDKNISSNYQNSFRSRKWTMNIFSVIIIILEKSWECTINKNVLFIDR